VTAAPNDSEIFSGDVFTPTADFSDPGRLDSPWTSEIDWGFGDTERVQRLAQGPFTMSKRYLRAGRYTVGVGVTDKDGGRGDASLNLLVKRLPVSVLVWPNPITLGRRDFGVVVAIVLSTDRVDATTIDPATATLGDERGQEAAAVNLRDVAWQTSTGDANGDGRADMVLTFRKADLQANGDLTAATSQLILLADLAGGRQIRGVGATRVVP
jgi:hypothetical protein